MIGIYLIGIVFVIVIAILAIALLACLADSTIEAIRKRNLFYLFIYILLWILIIGVICVVLGI